LDKFCFDEDAELHIVEKPLLLELFELAELLKLLFLLGEFIDC